MTLSHHASLVMNHRVLIHDSSSVFSLTTLVLWKSAGQLFGRMPLYVTTSDI